MTRRVLQSVVAPLGAAVALIALWYALRHVFGVPAWLLPMPDEVLAASWKERALLGSGAWQTTQNALLGFFSAALGGLALALVLGSADWVRRGLYPLLLILQMTPVIVIAPFIVLWRGRGMESTVLVTFIVSFLPVVVSTTHGMVSTDRGLVELFDVWKASRWQKLWYLRLPHAMPGYFAGLRIAAAMSPVAVIFVEYVTGALPGGVGGLGFLAAYFQQRQQPAELLGVALASCVLGFVFLGVVSIVRWLLLRRWHDSVSRSDV